MRLRKGVEIKAGASVLDIRCRDCGEPIEHECRSAAQAAARLLREFVAAKETNAAAAVRRSVYAEDGDERAPFFSEAFLYPLLGKSDARAVLSALDELARAAGVQGRR